uniref:Ribosomal protein L22 n=1 Tax=Caenorhabditis tropicalis TaxID=1561998 RepID=A0A1I7T832_9PELO
MGKFRNQKKNLVKNKVATSVNKAKQMKAAARKSKTDGEVDVQMAEDVPRVRGLAVSSLKKLASGELKNVPKVNEKKIIRKTELPVREGKKILDAPTGKRGTTAQYITKKKAKKMYKKMTHDARDHFRKFKQNWVKV